MYIMDKPIRRILGLGCNWYLRQANNIVGSQRSLFSKNQELKRFVRVAVNPYVPIFWGVFVCGGRKLISYRGIAREGA